MPTAEILEERRKDPDYGGSVSGIRQHYDVGNAYWGLMLGPTWMYSAALYMSLEDDLETAQQRKIDWHFESAGAARAKSLLDVGCGWGTVLSQSSKMGMDRVVGLTLSQAQAEHLAAMKMRNVEVRVENWARHEPPARFDSIISIGAFEHFAKPKETPQEKLGVYRDFFARCHRWLEPTGRMSLQTIAYGTMRREDASEFINTEIYPESDLPTLSEIVAAVDGLFEIERLHNDRFGYARAYDAWLRNLRSRRDEAVKMVGEAEVRRFEKFFKLGSMGFRMGKLNLLRIGLRPITKDFETFGVDPLSLEPKYPIR